MRIYAEFMIFIAQTGINIAQTTELKRDKFRYRAIDSNQSWHVTVYKSRAGHEVSFDIFKDYKKRLNEHIEFIKHFFPDSDFLFPVFAHNGKGTSKISDYKFLYGFLVEHDIPWVPPRSLRKTRINWILRRSGDPTFTADVAQHTVEVLKRHYELPSQQRSMNEITRFFNKLHDPIQEEELRDAIILAQCNGEPRAIESKPKTVPAPNCVNPTGCLWCEHLRDIDTFDYVWGLVTFRHLKSIEAVVIKSDTVPSDIAIDRLSDKIEWYCTSSDEREAWVKEAEMRVSEGDYHPNWSAVIKFLE